MISKPAAKKSTATKSTAKKSTADSSAPKGPASYFPSIERTYGHPVEHWFALLGQAGEKKHMEYVALLKAEHAIGHGHANALVAYWLADK